MFCFRLALALGMTVRELLARVDSRELAEWMAYYGLEPFGQARDNLHAGIVAATVVNANRRRGSRPVRADAFLLGRPRAETRAGDPAALYQRLRAHLVGSGDGNTGDAGGEVGRGGRRVRKRD